MPGGGWNVGQWKARMSSCPQIIPEQLKSHYFNERHDIVSIGVIQPCGQSKQQTLAHIWQILADFRLYEHFSLWISTFPFVAFAGDTSDGPYEPPCRFFVLPAAFTCLLLFLRSCEVPLITLISDWLLFWFWICKVPSMLQFSVKCYLLHPFHQVCIRRDLRGQLAVPQCISSFLFSLVIKRH